MVNFDPFEPIKRDIKRINKALGLQKPESEANPKKVIEPFNIHVAAFWKHDLVEMEKKIRKLDTETLKKLYGIEISITPDHFFPHPVTGEPMTALTRSVRGIPYLIIFGTEPDEKRFYHEIAHAIGIEDESEAQAFAERKIREAVAYN